MASPWKTVWITGASSGIGREIALIMAARGITVAVSARSANKLRDLATGNPNIVAYPLDVTDAKAVTETAHRIETEHGPIDLAILNAGAWDPMHVKEFSAARIAAAMDVNVRGITHALEPLIAAMIARRNGHLALVASIAGYRGLQKAAAYAPGKAAVINLAEVLKIDLAPYGVIVSVINPGFVRTPMTAINTFPMPFIIDAEDAARRIVRGLEKKKFEIAFPWQLVAMLKILRLLPYRAYFAAVNRFFTPKK